jgi:hypothetical protein
MKEFEFVIQRFTTPSCIRKLVCLEATSRADPESYSQEPPGEDPCILNTP